MSALAWPHFHRAWVRFVISVRRCARRPFFCLMEAVDISKKTVVAPVPHGVVLRGPMHVFELADNDCFCAIRMSLYAVRRRNAKLF